MLRIGIISDTHGLLRPEATAALSGCDHLLHAGDIGRPEVIEGLRRIAPVTAVRGNVDRGPWAEAFPEMARLTLGGRRILVLHDRKGPGCDAAAATAEGIDILVSGHSHRPEIRQAGPVLYLNPGSAGPRRFRLPVALAILEIAAEGLEARIVELRASVPSS